MRPPTWASAWWSLPGPCGRAVTSWQPSPKRRPGVAYNDRTPGTTDRPGRLDHKHRQPIELLASTWRSKAADQLKFVVPCPEPVCGLKYSRRPAFATKATMSSRSRWANASLACTASPDATSHVVFSQVG